MNGKPLQALLFNPLMLACTLFILLQQSSTLLCKRRLALEASPGQKQIATAVLAVLFILNWLYVMVTVA